MNPIEDVTNGNMAAYLIPRDLVTNASALIDVFETLVTEGVVVGGQSLNVARGQAITQATSNSINPAWKNAIHNLEFGL